MYANKEAQRIAEEKAAKTLRIAKVATVAFLIGCAIAGFVTFGMTTLL